MIISIVGIKDVSFEAGIKENHVQNNDKQLDGLHTPLNDISLHNDSNNNLSNPQLRNAANRKVYIPHYNQLCRNNENNNLNEQVFLIAPTSTSASSSCDIGLSNGNDGNA
ncbi:Hypothetical predicted protein [Paramuricea clavata]|uniref:Uncharacterized protein n=1 Tax=Paramuricea clavata TaxID=317549 RepID=A0A7D9EBH9_PARCT|nr:Hypothetical predicted protein [Paramuricea clavata]